jgi:trimeric autotransporter adhesin
MRTFITVILLFLFGVSQATDVSGIISTPTVWTQALSPYVVTGNVTVTSTLTIESNVQVRFSAGTGLTVGADGRLLANGLQNARVVFTSVRDVLGANPAAQPGDWNYLRIGRQSPFSEGSVLNYVQVRFGKGLDIVESSPRIANSVFENNQIAAISMDRRSSPSGAGLSGTGNGINGILVPAGEITGSVEWRLKGLPYVINDGVLHVGAKPAALTFKPLFFGLSPNATGQIQIDLSDPAPSPTLISFTRDNTASLALPASVTIPTGGYSAAIAIQALATGNATLTANSSLGSATIVISVAPRPALQMFPVTVANSRMVDSTVSLQSVSNVGGVTVSLVSANPTVATVPATVQIPSGINGVNFSVTGVTVGSTTLTASAPGFDPITVAVTTRPLSMTLPTVITAPFGVRNARLIFSDLVPPGGTSFSISSSNPAIFSVPGTLPAPAGAGEINVPITGLTEGSGTVTVTHPDYGTVSATVVVAKIQLSWVPVSASIPSGLSDSFQLNLSQGAPVGGLSVALVSSDVTKASVSVATIAVAPSATEAIARVTLTGLAQGSATITASAANTLSGVLPVSVTEPAQFVFVPISYKVGVGLRAVNPRLEVRSGGQSFVPNPPLTISLTSSDPAKLTLPATVTTSASGLNRIALVGVAASTAPISVTASAPGITSAGAMAVDVIAPTLEFVGIDDFRGISSPRDDFYLRWRVPQSSEPEQLPAVTQTIALGISDATPSTIVEGVFDSPSGGQLTGNVQITPSSNISPQRYVGAPSALGSYKISATVPGVGTYLSTNQVVAGLSLRFNRASYIVGKGMGVGQVLTVERVNGGTPVVSSTPLSVTLTASDPSRVGVASVTIPAFYSQAYVFVSGVELTANTVISATALNYTAAPPLAITVVDPQLVFYSLPDILTPVSPRKQFCLQLKVPSSETIDQYPLLSVGLSVAAATPSNVMDGYYSSFSGGVPITTVNTTFPGTLLCAYLGAPGAAGSFRIQAAVPGNANSPWLSPVQNVVPNVIGFASPTLTVSKGLRLNAKIKTPETPTVLNVIALACTLPTLCQVPASIPMPAFANREVEFPLLGVNLGAGQISANSTPPDLGNITAGLSVVPLTAYFYDYGPDPFNRLNGERGLPQSGWGLTFSSPGVANTELTVNLELVDVVPPDAASVTSSSVTIDENSSSSNPNGYTGFYVTDYKVGTYKIRATIPGLGTWTSDAQPSGGIGVGNCSFEVGVGVERNYNLRTTLSNVNPIIFSSVCSNPQVCATTSPAVLLAGSRDVSLRVRGVTPGSTTVAINAPPFLATNLSAEVVAPRADLYGPSAVRVGVDTDFTVVLEDTAFGCGFADLAAVNPITISAVSSDPSKLTVPTTFVMAAGSASAVVRVRGLVPGTVNLSIGWPGLQFPQTVTVQVLP